MRKAGLLALLLLVAAPAVAQDSGGFFSRLFGSDDAASDEEQGGMLETFIEDNLSGEGRTVSITGFAGALSGRATLETLIISDDQGEWLTLTDVVLDWNRGALFRGRLEVAELSAAEIRLLRLPAPVESEEPPTPEASGFSLPELPVSVAIDSISAARVSIGQPVFGTAVEVAVDGGLRLDGGEGEANLNLQKLVEPGAIKLGAAYSNATEVLALNLDVSEAPDGIIAGLLDLPGRPSVDFSVIGEAPLSSFTADIRLATDGVERLTGRVETSRPEGGGDGTLRTVAQISGDIAPIFNPEYQLFFGPDVRIGTIVTSHADGRLDIDDLAVSAAALDIAGRIRIGADGLPDEISVDGAIASGAGPVLLPLPGPETRVTRVDLDIGFDAAEDDRWTGAFDITGLDRAGFSAERMTLNGSGRITSAPEQSLTANLNFSANALDLGNPEAEEALGETVSGRADISWTAGGPLRLSGLDVDGESYGLRGNVDVAFEENGPVLTGTASASAERLSAFSGLAGRTLGGRIAVDADFSVAPLAGTFAVDAEGSGENLVVSQPQADAILDGAVRLDLTARRDETGIAAVIRTLETPKANLSGQADLKSGGSSVSVSGTLQDASIILPQISGPVRLDAAATEDDERVWTWSLDTSLEETSLTAKGTAIDIYGTPVIAASGRLEAADLSKFAELAARPLAGAIATDFGGEVVTDLSRVSIDLNGTATDLRTGMAEADALLVGTVDFAIDGAMAGEVLTLRNSTISGQSVRLRADGTLVPGAGRFALEGRLADASLLLPQAPAMALEFSTSARQNGTDWQFETAANGAGLSLAADGVALDPLGQAAAIEGQIRLSADDLSVLADLAGRPLTGRVTLDARGGLTADLARIDLSATASGSGLSIGQAQADRLVAGDVSLVLDARREDEAIEITTLNLSTGLVSANASGSLVDGGGEIDLTARLAEIASFAPGFAGPATVAGTIGTDGGGRYVLDLKADGPGGAEISANGSVAADFQTVGLDIDGRVPLGFLNEFIAPRSVSGMAGLRLSVNGPPALGSVAGQITVSGGRVIAPNLGIVLNDVALNGTLSSGRAQIALNAAVEGGGAISVEGPVTLSAPFDASLGIVLNRVVLKDPKLYETSVDGRISIDGPLSGGARIGGNLALGETNIRIPSSGLGGAGAVPEIIHLNEPPPVRGTRRKAGLLDIANRNGRASGPSYPLDITVNAPSRIFIRGRGLDSEFGGSLRVTGNTNDVVPIGAFNLIRGRLDILGQRLALEEANVTIQGSFLPIVRIRATTQSDEYAINVIVAGPVNDPEITFTSEPELPQEEVLARLIFGRGLDTLSPLQAARLALAVRTLAGRGGEGVVGKIRQGAGFADLDVTTDETGSTAVRAGAYLGENIYTDVTVGASGDTEINLNLDVSPSVTLKGSASNRGDTSVGIFFERDY